jgi:hypothetical protein
MTQAFNLSQLANFTNSSGQVDASTGLFNATQVANGGTGGTTATDGKIGLEVITAGTGSQILPVGNTAERDSPPSAGYLRFNSETGLFEGYNGIIWGSIGGSQAGGAVFENKQIISADYTMTSGYNGESVGPITIGLGVTVIIPTDSRWIVL